MPNSKVITIWYRRDEDGVYQHNHLEDGYDEARTKPTPKVTEHNKAWKSGKWAQQRAMLLNRGPNMPPVIVDVEGLVLV